MEGRYTLTEAESQRSRNLIKTSLEAKRSKGQLCGTVPYGWDAKPTGQRNKNGKEIRILTENPIEQQGIRKIIVLRAKGYGFERIAKELNRLGIPTKLPTGTIIKTKKGQRASSGKWQFGNVCKVLSNSYTRMLIERFSRGELAPGDQENLESAARSLPEVRPRVGRPPGRSITRKISNTREDRYERYLGSEHWRELSERKLRIVGSKCEDCGKETSRLHVHHLRYKNLYDVELSDLLVLCPGCHRKRHGNTVFEASVP